MSESEEMTSNLPTVFALQRKLHIEDSNARSANVKAQDVKVPFSSTRIRAYKKKNVPFSSVHERDYVAPLAARERDAIISDTERRERLRFEREELRQHRLKVDEYEQRTQICKQGTKTLEEEIKDMEEALVLLKLQAKKEEELEVKRCETLWKNRKGTVDDHHVEADNSVQKKKNEGRLEESIHHGERRGIGEEELQRPSTAQQQEDAGASNHQVPKMDQVKLMSGIRGESLLLISMLDEKLPLSSMVDTLRLVDTSADDLDSNASISEDIINKVGFLDDSFRQASEIVGQMSSETSELCRCLREKYGNLIATIVAVNEKMSLELEAERTKRKGAEAISTMQNRLIDKQQNRQEQQKHATSELASTVEELQMTYTKEKEVLNQKISDVTKEKKILEGEVKHFQLLLAKADEDKEQAMTRIASGFATELDEAQRERSDLEQQMIYLKKQVARTLRESLIIRGPPVMHAEIQTDDNIIIIETKQKEKGYNDDIDSLVVDAVKSNTIMTNEILQGGDDNNSLGPFRQYVLLRRQGTVRPLSFILRCVAQIYYDLQLRVSKSVLVGDHDVDPNKHMLNISSRMASTGNFALCVYNWFLGMHGIRTVAEAHLVDFLASVSHYQGLSTKLIQFSKLCGLYDELSDWNNFDVLEMYFSCISALCSEGILRFFTGSSNFIHDGTFKITPFDVLSTLPKIFKELEKPDLLQSFMNEKVVPMIESKGSTIDGDMLVNVLVTEFIQRRNRTKSKLEASVFTIQQETPEEQQIYTSFDEFKRIFQCDVIKPSIETVNAKSNKTHKMSGSPESIFGTDLELFSASLRVATNNKVSPPAVARAALHEEVIRLMKASELRELYKNTVDRKATKIVDSGKDTADAEDQADALDEVDDENVENLACDNLRVILNGITELRYESFDDSFKSLLEHGASPEDGDLIHEIAELNATFKKALMDMSHETSSEYTMNTDLKAKRNNSVTAYSNYKYEYELKKSKIDKINEQTKTENYSTVTNIADVQHAWDCYRKLVYSISTSSLYFESLNNKQNANLNMMKNNVNIASRMIEQRVNRGNSVTNLLHSDNTMAARKNSTDIQRRGRGSMTRHNSTYFNSLSNSFSMRMSEISSTDKSHRSSTTSDYLSHQQQQFEMHRSAQHQHSVYTTGTAKDHGNNSTYGSNLGQHASALITLLQ